MNSLQAQENLREVKNRPVTKAFPVMCSDLEQIKTIAVTDARSERIIQTFMPGPLTVILKRREDVPEFVN
ncbi:L-threonylcarbamoyladenylate synthase, partial [Acinetobacter pittii]|uniref:L-threonylcarbamoyladenylate synthase n=1 Tax=Acinetobacter pittii TaxID=48296 RepID=UPI0028145AB7